MKYQVEIRKGRIMSMKRVQTTFPGRDPVTDELCEVIEREGKLQYMSKCGSRPLRPATGFGGARTSSRTEPVCLKALPVFNSQCHLEIALNFTGFD